jgi:hypothetical protein
VRTDQNRFLHSPHDFGGDAAEPQALYRSQSSAPDGHEGRLTATFGFLRYGEGRIALDDLGPHTAFQHAF